MGKTIFAFFIWNPSPKWSQSAFWMHKQHPQTAYRKDTVSMGTLFENCDRVSLNQNLFYRCNACWPSLTLWLPPSGALYCWQDAAALGNVQGIRVQLLILPCQKQYFVLSNCAIIGSNNLCTVFWGGAATHAITNCSERYNEDGRRCHRKCCQSFVAWWRGESMAASIRRFSRR